MSPSYETIEEYQRLVKMLLTQIFLLSNMNQLNIKQLYGKAKVAHFRRHFSDRSKQRYYIGFLIKTRRVGESALPNIRRVKITLFNLFV